jgi:hypothetical protein
MTRSRGATSFLRIAPAALIVACALALPASAVARVGDAARLSGVSITSISPTQGFRGDTVTITGNGFGGPNVRVTVGGVTAKVLTATGASAKFVVPATAPFGPTTVRATNPGGQFGEIAFTVLVDLSQVTAQATPDPARRVVKTIGRFGGTVETDGADGTHYRLDVPAGALSVDTQIALAPASVSGLDALAGQVSAAVDFAPDGLQFAVPAYLTITLSAPAATTFAATFHSGVPGIAFLLPTVSGNVISVPVEHFSNLATLLNVRQAALNANISGALANAPELDSPQLEQLIAAHLLDPSDNTKQDALVSFLTNLYTTTVAPAIQTAANSLTDWEVANQLVHDFGAIVQTASTTPGGGDFPSLKDLFSQGVQDVSGKGETLLNRYSDSGDPTACTGAVADVTDWIIIPLRLSADLQALGDAVTFTPCLTAHVETLVPFPATIDSSVESLTTTYQASIAAPAQTPGGITNGNQVLFPEPAEYELDAQGATFAGGGTTLDTTAGADGTLTAQLDRGPDPSQRAPTVSLSGTATIGDLGFVLDVTLGVSNIVPITQTVGSSCQAQPSFAFRLSSIVPLARLDQCAPIGVTISPTSITLTPGQSATFTATVTGTSDQTVGWTATGGTIDQNGTYTAGPTTGTYTVTATSNADSSALDTATVTILQDAGVTRVRSQGYVGIGCDDTGPPVAISPDGAISWQGAPPPCSSDIVVADGNGNVECEYGADTSGNSSFQEAYASNGDLLSAHTTGSISADGWGTFDQQTGQQCLGSGGGVADYSITFSVAHDGSKVTVQGSDSGSGHAGADVRIYCLQFNCIVPYIAPHQGSFTQTLTLDAGTYRFDCHLTSDTTQIIGDTSCDAEIRFG